MVHYQFIPYIIVRGDVCKGYWDKTALVTTNINIEAQM